MSSLPLDSSLPPPQAPASTSPLAQALHKNETVHDAVEQSAVELVMINTVLKQEIPDHVQVGDVAQALQRADELEVKISDAANGLAEVNEVLAQEIDQRAELERELMQTKAALVEAQGNPAQP